MSVTIGSLTFTRLTAQPFGYEESETRDGLTARKWVATGLLTNSEWSNLIGVYESWRNTRIQDPDSVASNSVGTTVALTATANGMTWSAVPCWFVSAPSADQVGAYLQAKVELVDAAQALAVALKAKEKEKEASEDLPDLGTFTVGAAVLKLLKPPETYQDLPQMQLTAAGNTYFSGPLSATIVRDIEGTTDAAGWQAVRTWFEATVATAPAAGQYFPLSEPVASAKNDVVNGLKVVTYTVTLKLGVVR